MSKVVLAYSGGLDTSVILKWLTLKGLEVIAFVGNVGQKEDFEAIAEKAYQTGAAKVYLEDLRREFVTDFIFPALRANAYYEGRYLMGTALARPLLAKKQVEIAEQEGAAYVAHGATGKGNDQVRFELTYYALKPDIQVISPWRDPEFTRQFAGRSDLIRFAREHGISVKATTKKPYSEDENLMHISHEAGILESPDFRPPEDVFSHTAPIEKTPDQETLLEIHFRDGFPVKVVDSAQKVEIDDPLELFEFVNKMASLHGIGRVDMVENRYIGIKSRGVYENPGAAVLWAAHADLEGLAMDKEVMHLRDMLMPKFAELVYNGYWYSPEMDFLMAAFNKSQEAIDGVVRVSLFKGNVRICGRWSPTSLYDQDLSSMEVNGGFDPVDATGFIRINAIRLRAHHLVLRKRKPYNWREEQLKPKDLA